MSLETGLKKANEALAQLNEGELSLEESVKTCKIGLESIGKARLEFEKVKLKVEKIDEQNRRFAVSYPLFE